MSARECIRFVVPSKIDDDSQLPVGIVQVAYDVLERADTPVDVRAELRGVLDWFEEHLDVPDRFNRTKSKGWYRRKTRGISWLRVSALDHVERMRGLAELVRRCGHTVTELRTTRIGYITYEDDVQIVAEPFRETPTR